MSKNNVLSIQNMIYEIRGQKVMLDSDLANLYEVELKVMNQAVKRSIKRFPSDFMFQLLNDEWDILRSRFVTSRFKHGGRRYIPYVFTEQGVAMLAAVLNSKKAIDVNIQIMRAFVKLRHFVYSETGTSDKINELRKLLMLHIDNTNNKFLKYDNTINHILIALNNLLEKPKETKKIGF